MAKIQRATQKIFAGKGTNDPIAVFGSMKTGNPIYTDNIEDLQSVAYENGWSDAIVADEAPFLEEMNGVQYGFSKQLAYLFQEGIPEYDAGTIYYKGSIIKALNTNNKPVLYYSLVDDNLNNPLTDITKWEEITFDTSGGGFQPSLFMPFPSLTKLNHPSLVESGAYSWLNDGYVSAYNELVERYNAGEDATETIGDVTISYKWNNQYAMKIITPEQIENAENIFDATGQQPYFILDIANTRFKLPRFKTIPQFTNDANSVGDYNEPALPNAKGQLRPYSNDGSAMFGSSTVANGIFYKQYFNNWTNMQATSNNYSGYDLYIDLSRASSVYKNGVDTVQPPTTNWLLYFYLGESEIEDTSITGEVLENLNNKLDTDAGNLSDAGKKVFDGQWVYLPNQISILKNVGVNTATISIADHLPSDNYKYEILLWSYLTSNAYLNIATSPRLDSFITVTGGSYGRATYILPIDTSRQLAYRLDGTAGNNETFLVAYRRLGTND